MKILFINLPFSGHIIPTLGLVQELVKRDNKIKCIRAFEHENVQVIMSIGSLVSKDRLGKIPDNFSIYSFVPQLEVLENADVFGANVIAEYMSKYC